jgi:pyruvate,orthophosphate dikinase
MTPALDVDSSIYLISGPAAPGASALAPDEVGSKAAHLQQLAAMGLRVPPAFVVTTRVCRAFLSAGRGLAVGVSDEIRRATSHLEHAAGRRLGGWHPLLVSVRSSPPVSMPGMLDTVLNVGLTEAGVHGLVRITGNPWLAWDAYRRLARGYAETVLGCPAAPFEHLVASNLAASNAATIQELDPLAMRELARGSAALARALAGEPIPDDPAAQLEAAVAAVFRSWSSPRASEYRRLTGVPDDTGTAVVVQSMVFGNGGGLSGSGVGFTRDPSTGADELYVDFLFNAQGEDVVSGRHAVSGASGLARSLPSVYDELLLAKRQLEVTLRDMQDFEFTVEDGRLFFLQTRSGKRTPWAALQIAVDLVRAGISSPAEALARLQPYDLSSIARDRLDVEVAATHVATGVGAGLGVASGAVVFDSERARARAVLEPVILVRPDIATDDVAGISAASGVLTSAGGRTSHASVVARHLGKVCVVGCRALEVDVVGRRAVIGGRTIHEGDVITLDGEGGGVYAGTVGVTHERPDEALAEVSRWRVGLGSFGAG